MEQIHPGTTRFILADYRDERRAQRRLRERALDIDRSNLAYYSRFQILRLLAVLFVALFFAAGGLSLILLDKPIQGVGVRGVDPGSRGAGSPSTSSAASAPSTAT